MASREFKDANGVSWHVWNTTPVSGAVINPGFDKGWLTFESADGALRRLAPIPIDWETVPSERLDLFCRSATPVPRHTGPFHRVSGPQRIADDESDRGDARRQR
jgi:hypothetical protein